MTKKENKVNENKKDTVEISIVCVPNINENKLVETKYELRVYGKDVMVRIPIRSGMPPEDILSRLLEMLDLTNAEISVDASIKETITIPVPTPAPSIPFEDPYKKYPWTSPVTFTCDSTEMSAPNNITKVELKEDK